MLVLCLGTGCILGMSVWIGKVKNNTRKRLAYPKTKIGYHWEIITVSDQKKFRKRRISYKEAFKLRSKLALFGINSMNKGEIRTLVCDKCGKEQENMGQIGCIYCDFS